MHVLISPGYGAGWSTEAASPEEAWVMLGFKPIVTEVLRRRFLAEKTAELAQPLVETDDCVQQLLDTFRERGWDEPYLGGLGRLTVVWVTEKFVVEEYDGHETVVLESQFTWLSPVD